VSGAGGLAAAAFDALRFGVLGAYAASGLYVHFRGRVRQRPLRQLTDHSTLLAPYNAFAYATSAVPTTPYLDPSLLPALDALRAEWRTIRDEALALFREGRIKKSDGYDDLAFNSFFKNGWTRFYLKWYDAPLPSARAYCPKTSELVQKTPGVVAAMFALLPPRARLGRHRDPFAGSLRYHLGLSTPNSDLCRIVVDGEVYSWRDGEHVVFDETFVHEAFNDTDVPRIIFFADVERPLRTPLARAINRGFSNTVMRAAATKNDDGDGVGFLNRAFKYAYAVRRVGKALKARNKPLYYVVKYALFAAILSLFLL
jgi:beta-hydroxylase